MREVQQSRAGRARPSRVLSIGVSAISGSHSTTIANMAYLCQGVERCHDGLQAVQGGCIHHVNLVQHHIVGHPAAAGGAGARGGEIRGRGQRACGWGQPGFIPPISQCINPSIRSMNACKIHLLDLLHQQVHDRPQVAAVPEVWAGSQGGAAGVVLNEGVAVHHCRRGGGGGGGGVVGWWWWWWGWWWWWWGRGWGGGGVRGVSGHREVRQAPRWPTNPEHKHPRRPSTPEHKPWHPPRTHL